MSLTLIVIYRPPSSNISFYEKFEKLLKECNFNKEVIIMGDFNISWGEKSSRKNFKQITDKFDLMQLINGPTRMTYSTSTQIDLICSNRPERILKPYNMVTGLFDHNLTLVARKLSNKWFSPGAKEYEFFGIPNKQENFKSVVQQIEWDDLLHRHRP